MRVSFADKMACDRGKDFRRKMPPKPVFSEPPEKVLYPDEPSQDTDSVSSDESISLLSQSVKRKLPIPMELKRENAVLRDMSSSDVCRIGGKGKDVSGVTTVIYTFSFPSLFAIYVQELGVDM